MGHDKFKILVNTRGAKLYANGKQVNSNILDCQRNQKVHVFPMWLKNRNTKISILTVQGDHVISLRNGIQNHCIFFHLK
jgi:hypothetical protein